MTGGRFAAKVAFITGAGSGIGRAVALRLAAEGAAVVVSDVDAGSANKTAEAVLADGGRSLSLALDTTDEAAVEAAIERSVRELGGIDVLVNCAGVPGPLGGPVDIETAAFEQTLKVNVHGLFLTCKHALPHLVASRGNIVNIASVAGLSGGGPPLIGPLVAYTTSKHAVIGLTRSIAYQYGADGVRANAVCPGSIVTGMTSPLMQSRGYVDAVSEATPLGRWGSADEVAACVAFLASSDAAFVSADVMTVDGGFMTSQDKVYPRFAAMAGGL